VLGESLDTSNSPISGFTKVYGLIGDPIDHSLSPAIQNAAFLSAGLNSVYVAFPVGKTKLRFAIQGLKSLGVMGFNVTTPYKTATMLHLDRVETGAAAVGSINTVKNEDGQLTGFNTDGLGALNALEQAGAHVKGRTLLVIGAGAAARAIAYALAGRGCSLELANRTLAKARRLAKDLNGNLGAEATPISLSSRSLYTSMSQADIILNASSMGMSGRNNPPIKKEWIRDNQWVFDIVYRPLRPKLLLDADSRGAKTINGLDMLVHQGACSFTIWTGKKASIREMRRAIARKLTAHNVRIR
jgi:shikimate dehydrogenase